MSGLEAAGIAASILQIADIGIKVSVNLYTFYEEGDVYFEGVRFGDPEEFRSIEVGDVFLLDVIIYAGQLRRYFYYSRIR